MSFPINKDLTLEQVGQMAAAAFEESGEPNSVFEMGFSSPDGRTLSVKVFMHVAEVDGLQDISPATKSN